MNWFGSKCRRHQENLVLLAAGVLADDERREVQAHLDQCPACQAEFAKMAALTEKLAVLGKELPQVAPSASLRRRWVAGVHESARADDPSLILSPWLSPRRAMWVGLAAIWVLIAILHITAPNAPQPPVPDAMASLSWREMLQIMEAYAGDLPSYADADRPTDRKPSPPETLPPSRNHSFTHYHKWEVV